MKTGDNGRHQAARHAGTHPNIDLPGQLPLTLTDIILRCAKLFQNQISAVIKPFPALGQGDTFTPAHKQLCRHALFQLFNGFSQRGLRKIQHPAGSANTALTRHFDKSPNLMKFNLK